jgi:outer membrane receptor for ferrienterochelin and colicins
VGLLYGYSWDRPKRTAQDGQCHDCLEPPKRLSPRAGALGSRPVRALLVTFAVLSAAPALADNTADEADIAFGVGNAAVAKHKYEDALAAYFLSYRLVPNRNVLFNIARCYEALNRYDEAYRYWHDLHVDPGLPEEDVKEVKQALARLAPRVALISVTTTPPGADLFVDRVDLGSRGKTPQTIAVAPGPHTVIVRLVGHRESTVKVSSTRGRDTKQALSLETIVGKVEFSGSPAGAIIRESADGPELGKVPGTLTFPPGQRLLLATAPGFLPAQVLVDVKAEGTVAAKVQLTEKPLPTGKVVVTSNRDNALVRVDDKESGFTPVVLTLTEGEHRLEVTSSEVVPFTRTLQVKENDEQKLFAELRYAPPKVAAASKNALSVDQAPASVTVITREELQSFGYQTLTEALQAVRGFFITDDHIYNYIGLRGFAPAGDLNTRILILYDGHSVNDVWAGQGYAERSFIVDLEEIDRIEVVRGPASTLFGTGALFGVINVVPRNRLAPKNVEGTIGVGAANGGKVHLTGSMGDEKLSALVAASGSLASGDQITNLGPDGVVNGYDAERVMGAEVRVRAGDFTVMGKWNQRRKEVPDLLRASNPSLDGQKYWDTRGLVEARYAHDWGKVSLVARLTYDASRFEGHYTSLNVDTGAPQADTELGGADWLGAEVRVGVIPFGQNHLTASVESQYQMVYQQPVGDTLYHFPRVLLAGTVIDEWQATDWLFFQVGARVDKYTDLTTTALSPRGALVLKPYKNGLTKLVAGQAFRAPNIYELNYNDANATTRKTDGLVPELVTAFEVEHSHDLTPELRFTVGAYYTLIDKLVELNQENAPVPICGPIDAPIQCLVYANSTTRLTAFGAEGEFRWQPARFTLVDGKYSFVMLGGRAAGDLPAYPAHVASVRALIPLKELREGLVRISAQVVYQSARGPTPDAQGQALLVPD